jgi:hypothetical protein
MMMETRPISRRRAVQTMTMGGLAATVLSRRQPSLAEAGDLEIAKVPPKVQEAAKRVVPNARWLSADKNKEGNEDVYDLEGEDGKARKVMVVVTAEGKVTELRTKVPLAEVPRAVWEAAAKKLPTFEVITAYELREGDDLAGPTDGDLSYEVSGVYSNKRQVIFEITADGEISEMEKEVSLTEVPKGVTAALAGKLPKFKATTAFELSEGGAVVGYQFEGKRSKEKKVSGVFVSADGKEIEANDE